MCVQNIGRLSQGLGEVAVVGEDYYLQCWKRSMARERGDDPRRPLISLKCEVRAGAGWIDQSPNALAGYLSCEGKGSVQCVLFTVLRISSADPKNYELQTPARLPHQSFGPAQQQISPGRERLAIDAYKLVGLASGRVADSRRQHEAQQQQYPCRLLACACAGISLQRCAYVWRTSGRLECTPVAAS